MSRNDGDKWGGEEDKTIPATRIDPKVQRFLCKAKIRAEL